MYKFYYLTGAMILVLGGLGIYSSQAGNNMLPSSNTDTYIEQVTYSAPTPNQAPTQEQQNTLPNQTGDFIPLPEDNDVEVAPINSNPNLEQNPATEISIQESISETLN